MATIYRFGESEITSNSNFVLGTQHPLQSLAPGKLAIKSSSEQDLPKGKGASQLQVVGFNKEGKKTSEFVTLNGVEPVTTFFEYVAIDVVRVSAGGENAGRIQFFDISGNEVLVIREKQNESSRTLYRATGDGAILSYGASVFGDPNYAGAFITLSVISKGRKKLIHKFSLSQFASTNYNYEFRAQPQFKEGDTIVVEAYTEGKRTFVYGWMELEVE